MLHLLNNYPPWFVIAALALAAAGALWILIRVVKVVLWFLLIAVVLGGAALTVWALLR